MYLWIQALLTSGGLIFFSNLVTELWRCLNGGYMSIYSAFSTGVLLLLYSYAYYVMGSTLALISNGLTGVMWISIGVLSLINKYVPSYRINVEEI